MWVSKYLWSMSTFAMIGGPLVMWPSRKFTNLTLMIISQQLQTFPTKKIDWMKKKSYCSRLEPRPSPRPLILGRKKGNWFWLDSNLRLCRVDSLLCSCASRTDGKKNKLRNKNPTVQAAHVFCFFVFFSIYHQQDCRGNCICICTALYYKVYTW